MAGRREARPISSATNTTLLLRQASIDQEGPNGRGSGMPIGEWSAAASARRMRVIQERP